ncbi:GNAT family N-acetyltransferase [Arthrobacter sp. Y-9]|uniref:GNAT family N-acetyltransferase n=1 Tax=Arthrobacter sp. Y-9 TaxID=3039385 RepID=UPI00241DA8D3|nr:GNAT family N-acetyltransferase [Arthrobacter sp. Y-9]WFR85249.1 GNAT family N-acetyltransferase [Arthrobacter sp. Y-9]
MPETTTQQTPEPPAQTAASVGGGRSPGRVRILPVRPEEDGDLIHSWVTQERARFWGMTEYTRDEVVEVYRFLDSLPTHHAFLLTLDEEPVALFQSYDPFHDPVGEAYEPQEGDLGIHLFMAPAREPRPGLTPWLVLHFIGHLFATTGARRIVVEPDVRNDKALARLTGSGFEPGPVIQLPDKQAQLFFLRREVFERLPTVGDSAS